MIRDNRYHIVDVNEVEVEISYQIVTDISRNKGLVTASAPGLKVSSWPVSRTDNSSVENTCTCIK